MTKSEKELAAVRKVYSRRTSIPDGVWVGGGTFELSASMRRRFDERKKQAKARADAIGDRPMEDFSHLIGKTYEEADALVGPDMIIRVYGQDGNYGLVTADYRLDRLNVYMERGVISYVKGVG